MDYYNEIKNEIIDIETYKRVKDYSKNKKELDGYYKIGKLIVEAQGGESRAKYGNGLIKEYSIKLTKEFGKGYSAMNLKDMRRFYLFIKKGHSLNVQLSWTHYKQLLPLIDDNKIRYYEKVTLEQRLGYRDLQKRIKNKEYERLDEETKEKLIKNEEPKIGNYIKKPILIKINKEMDIASEKSLKYTIMDNITDFMKELGDGYAFIESEYKISDYGTNNYIDLLLFNIKYNCYTVVELKVTELKKEHIGQVQTYMNYIDENLKNINQNKTIGIIVCKKDNKFVMHYCNNKNIYQTTYLTVNEEKTEYNITF